MMQKEGRTAISANAIVLLLGWAADISSANLLTDIPKHNPLNINWDPAPSPEDGPPLSASASRDPSLLPAQIGGIVGAYLFSVCIVGIALIVIGRRLRHLIQRSVTALDIEMVQPSQHTYGIDPSPITPGTAQFGARNFSWPSPEKTDRNPYTFPTIARAPSSPPGGGDPYVDHRIVEADREMLQRDLEDLYAHVMEQEEAKAAGVDPKEMPPPTRLHSAGPVPAVAPQRQDAPSKVAKARPANLDIDESKPVKSSSRTSSIISSLKSPKRKGIRGLRISSPIPTPLSASFAGSQASDEEPLSPRYYSPPPPPPVPKDQTPYTHHRTSSNGAVGSPTRSIAEQLASDGNRGVAQFHRPNPSQASLHSSRDPGSATSANSQTPLFPPSQQSQSQSQPPNLKIPGTPTQSEQPTNNSSRTLPFRQFEPALSSPSFSHSTKTTVLERSHPNGGHGPQTGGMRTPFSAGAVPYSPYQPYTPIMPITPRLVTKDERKAKKKAEGRAPVLEMIKSDDEMWDSGY